MDDVQVAIIAAAIFFAGEDSMDSDGMLKEIKRLRVLDAAT